MESTTRDHALDMVRAVALLLGIFLHSTMSFLPGFRAVGWPVNDVSPSVALGVVFYTIHMFRMTLFFLLAGYFAKRLHENHGTREFIRNRLKRVALPLVIFWPIVLPLTIVPMIWAVAQTGPLGPPTLPPPTPGRGISFANLWCLYVLLIFYVGALGLRTLVANGVDRSGTFRSACSTFLIAALRKHYVIVILAVPAAAFLYFTNWWVPWLGVPTPERGFIPNVPSLVAYGISFGFGWSLHGHTDVLHRLSDAWFGCLVAAVALTAATLAIVGIVPDFTTHPMSAISRAAFAFGYVAGAWCWSFCLIGIGGRFFETESKPVRYLADASYWMYLVHLPIVLFLQAWMMTWPVHWSIKYPLIVVLTSAPLLISYHFLVRFTWLGALLSGRRRSRASVAMATVSALPRSRQDQD
jgi:fucose 4-O-acetylase-like acetyltransferase